MSQLVPEALRQLFLLAFPLTLIVVICGFIGATLQAATTIRDRSSLYGLRLLGLLVVLMLFLPSWLQSFLEFSGQAFSYSGR